MNADQVFSLCVVKNHTTLMTAWIPIHKAIAGTCVELPECGCWEVQEEGLITLTGKELAARQRKNKRR